MHISSFVNNPEGISPQSNEYAAGMVSVQSFSQRKEIERSRTVIGAYMQSTIGTAYVDRSMLQKAKPRPSIFSAKETNMRQKMNSRMPARYERPASHTFREPRSRGYDPYA